MRSRSVLALCLAASACAPAKAPDPEPRPVASPLSEKPFASPAEPELLALPVEGFLSAVVALPGGAERLPLLVVAHGAGDKPEWQCEWWSAALGSRAVVLCLRGSAMYPRRADTGFYFRDHHALGRELVAALAAVEREHGARLAQGAPVFAGFSQGAIMGALVAQERAPLFSRLILIEGGYDEWSVASAKKLGPARVLFACGQEYCASRARTSVQWLRRAGVEARLEHAPGAGHTYADAVGDKVLAALPWLVEGDARWGAPLTSSRR
ncbi:MAG: hypothetical protein HS104_01195 [Polyangiaceae bacterium]|nr:hypothetical protein [Polyangiaceae bacterium]MCL4752718.1 hypothetical protein [Myxococcales bacterium]